MEYGTQNDHTENNGTFLLNSGANSTYFKTPTTIVTPTTNTVHVTTNNCSVYASEKYLKMTHLTTGQTIVSPAYGLPHLFEKLMYATDVIEIICPIVCTNEGTYRIPARVLRQLLDRTKIARAHESTYFIDATVIPDNSAQSSKVN